MASATLPAAPGQIVRIPAAGAILEGELVVPAGAEGVVLFAHGSGSSRHSPRNKHVAHELREGHLGTLLIDLLTHEEEAIDLRTRHLRFDIELLADRLADTVRWLADDPRTRQLAMGLFGASTGGGAALVAAARQPELVRAVVSRGGRPDLAGDSLPLVQAPTLLVIGERDRQVIAMNQDAMDRMRCETQIELVPGATHLFEEPGALEEVARLARWWFEAHLTGRAG